MSEEKSLTLEAGKRYKVVTFYDFKIGPHDTTFLGKSIFRSGNRYFFRRESRLPDDCKEYFVLELDFDITDRHGFHSKIRDLETDDSEIVLTKHKDGSITIPCYGDIIEDDEKSELVGILNNFGEKL